LVVYDIYPYTVHSSDADVTNNILYSEQNIEIDNLAITEWVQRGASVYGKKACDQFGRVTISDDGNTVLAGITNWTSRTGDSAVDDQGNCNFDTADLINVGGARVLDWNGSTWAQRGNDFLGRMPDTNFDEADSLTGYARGISKDNNTIIIGGFRFRYGDESVRVWDWDSDNKIWKQRGLSINCETGESDCVTHGAEVSISDDGDSIAVSTPMSSNNVGCFYCGFTQVLDWNGSAWVRRGDKFLGKEMDGLGRSAHLSSDGNSIVISARMNSDYLSMAGAVRIYDWNGSAWVQRGLDIYGQEEQELLGAYHGNVDIDDSRDTIVIGSLANQEGNGRVRVFDWDGSAWVQRGSNIDGEINNNKGYYVSLSNNGNTVSSSSNGTTADVRVYDWNDNAWVQRGLNLMEFTTENQHSTWSSLSGDGKTISTGTAGTDINGLDEAGEMRVYDWK
jgi:hypothetical protein